MRGTTSDASGSYADTWVYILGVEEVHTQAYGTGTPYSGATRYYALPGGVTAERDVTGLQYLAKDALGTPILTYSLQTGAVLGLQLRAPYGQPRLASRAGSNGGMHTTLGFTGQREDAQGAGASLAGGSGLDYFNARYYDPAIGRFAAADSVRGADPLGDNYAYVGGRVEVATDPSGHAKIETADLGTMTEAQWQWQYFQDAMGSQRAAYEMYVFNPGAFHQAEIYAAANGVSVDTLRLMAGREAEGVLEAHLHDNYYNQTADLSAEYMRISGATSFVVSAATGADKDGAYGPIHGDAGRGGVPGGEFKGAAADLAADARDLRDEIASAKEALGGCGESFSPDTRVATPGGGERAIGDLKVGDTVEAYDPQTGKTQAKTVQRVFIDRDTDLLDLTLRPDAVAGPAAGPAPSGDKVASGKHGDASSTADTAQAGEVVHTTAKHPWLTTDHGWVTAGALRLGERVRMLDGGTATVVAARVVPGVAAMWDLTVSDVHTFAVGSGGYVVHNCGSTSPDLNGVPNEGNRAPQAPRGPNPPYKGQKYDTDQLQRDGWVQTSYRPLGFPKSDKFGDWLSSQGRTLQGWNKYAETWKNPATGQTIENHYWGNYDDISNPEFYHYHYVEEYAPLGP